MANRLPERQCFLALGLPNLSERFLLCFSNLFQRWVAAFREEGFSSAIRTNNGVETQNKEFKREYLAHHKDKSLSGMLTVLVESYLKEKYAKYVSFFIFACTGLLHITTLRHNNSFYPESCEKGIIYSQALRHRRIITDREGLN